MMNLLKIFFSTFNNKGKNNNYNKENYKYNLNKKKIKENSILELKKIELNYQEDMNMIEKLRETIEKHSKILEKDIKNGVKENEKLKIQINQNLKSGDKK